MANYIEPANIKADRFVTPTSRYADSTVYYYTENKLITFETYKRNSIPESASDKYTVIKKSMEYRPDLMSKAAYGTVDFWWKILEANGMKDIMEFKTGVNIRLPQNIYV
jgi:hypothetical protein